MTGAAGRAAIVALLLALASCGGLPCRPAAFYAPPADAPYGAQEVRVATPAGHVLAGTLTRPTGPAAPPAVVLITGSKAQDRDMVGSTDPLVSRYRPFHQIADTLGRRGIAVLRLDDRGTACSSGGDLAAADTADRAGDTRAAVAFLRARPDIDGRRLGLLGISEGADIAIMVAAGDPGLAAVVTMAATAAPGWQVWKHQVRYLISRGEEMDPDQKARWRAGEDPERILDERVAQARAHVAAGRAGAWWTFFFDHDPLPAARRVRAPVLVLHGDKDSSVPVDHAGKLARALRTAGNRDVTVILYPDHNHLFLPDREGGFRDYARVLARTQRIPDGVLRDIAGWLADRLAAPAGLG
ncbi:MAG: alpha/beta hydrolase [Hyphomicrobiales bacterium]|nr:alpha/beta hydrolase [Hyphomicrobiales bacterium]